jgi:hypothetical protein
LLTDTYNGMATDLGGRVKQASSPEVKHKLQEEAVNLEDRLKVIKALFADKGITEDKFDEITLELIKAINQAKSSE